jgi:peptide/nickel transport system substrate-binding protein
MKKVLAILLAASLLSLAGCNGSSSSGSSNAPSNSGASGTSQSTDGEAPATNLSTPGGKQGGTMVVYLSGDPSGWNPDYKSDDNLWPIAQNVFNRLIKLAPFDGIDMDLAKSYEFSEDGKTLTFHLHEGVKWHDGEPFTSRDVKWTYDTMISEQWFKAQSLESVESIECPDDNTVVFHLKAPDVTIIAKLAWYGTFILPAHIYEGTDVATNDATMNHPIGTGPFKFDSFTTGVSVKLTKNADFWGDEPMADEIVYSIITDQETAYQAFLNGEVDYYGSSIPTAHTHDLDDNPDYRLFHSLAQNRTYITFNFNDPDFSKVAVRQAFAYAVDRQGIYDRLGDGKGKAETFISPLQTDYVDENYKMPERDINKAMELLESAGYTKDADGFYLHTTFDCFESGNFGDIAQIVKANLAEAGIDITINMMEYAAWGEKVKDNKNYSVTMLAGYQGPDVSGVAARVQSDGSSNFGGYSNPELDEAMIASNSCSDKAERAKYLSTVQRIMSEDMPLVLLMDNGGYYPVRNTTLGSPWDVPEKAASSEMTYFCYSEDK